VTAPDSRDNRAQIAGVGQTPREAWDCAGDRPGEPDTANPRSRRPGPPCDKCGLPLDRHGYAFVSIHAAWTRAQIYGQWMSDRIRFGSATNPPPPRVGWTFVHRHCHQHPDFSDLYVLPMTKARIYRDLLDASIKLSRQKWAGHTDWQSMVLAIGDARRGRHRG
jgi:hypothetical protein